MADVKITALPAATAMALTDVFEHVDVSDNSGSVTGTNKQGTYTQLGELLKEPEVMRTDTSSQSLGTVGYTSDDAELTPGPTEVPTPSAGHYRHFVVGSAAITPGPMTEVGNVLWAFDAAVYSLDLSGYTVIGAPPASGNVNILFTNPGPNGPQIACWLYEA